MNPKDYYGTLGVSEGASTEDIKKAYRRLAKQHHPDANAGNKQAEERFKDISEANETLSDPEKRKQYDQMRRFGTSGGFQGNPAGFDGIHFEDIHFKGNPFENLRSGRRSKQSEEPDSFGGLNDLFSQVFGFERSPRKPRAPKQSESIEMDLPIPFELSVNGGETSFSILKEQPCPSCQGGGAKPGSRIETCGTCGGTGKLGAGGSLLGQSRPCPSCKGRGKIISNPCGKCHGSGRIEAKKSYSIKIPPGVEEGHRFRLKGEGKPGHPPNTTGDLFATVRIQPHRFFSRKGNDIHCEVELNLAQAVLGSTVKVKTIQGKKIQVRIAPGTQSGTMLRLPGMGVEHNGVRGDQYVTVKVLIPEKLTDEERELMSQFARKSGLKH
jgi:molecular chaperone DnaJ